MSIIKKHPLEEIGYGFVSPKYLTDGRDEYSFRYTQHPKDSRYRSMTPKELEDMKLNGNQSDNWSNVLVTDQLITSQIQNCKFYGLVRIGDMEAIYLEYRDIRLASGIYNCTIISTDIGDRVALHNVRYLAHFIIGNEVMMANVNEMETSSSAKFGNGILREGEDEEKRIYLELCNENGGRGVLPFEGMQAGDVYLWTRNRADIKLQQRFKELTEKKFSKLRGSYSEIGDRCVIKNCHTIKDVKIGAGAYIKGVNKLKNLTINSSTESYTQIGEGCELVNGIIGYGCRIFYGVKAVRFILSSYSQLKYGARLINSFLGDNSTISCCEVLNSLIFPAHEQHHNNSFLCASLIMGQSNMAAGATVGSNHNSRAADGEIIAGRGFWPGLCVSLKHNSKFASYALIVKGDFLHELNIRIPFSLISNDAKNDKLVIIPGYWFLYNMYALVRNVNKYTSRDKRQLKNQYLEYDMFAPDTINEMFIAMDIMKRATAISYYKDKSLNNDEALVLGEKLLLGQEDLKNVEILLDGFENSNRKVQLLKVREAYSIFRKLIRYYIACQIIEWKKANKDQCLVSMLRSFSVEKRSEWDNIGSQLMPKDAVNSMLSDIKSGKIDNWDDIHSHYHYHSTLYPLQKANHAFNTLFETMNIEPSTISTETVLDLLDESVKTQEWIYESIYNSRAKDYENEFKQMVYDSKEERDAILGAFEDNSFILQQKKELEIFKDDVQILRSSMLSIESKSSV